MKFSIITHAVHKVKDSGIYAYEPYVREMNLWLKYVDAVKIVAPFSSKQIISIDSKYISTRHPEPVEGFHDLESKDGMLNQVQHDESQRHSQLDWESHDLEPKGKSLRQAQTDISKEELQNQIKHDESIKLIKISSFSVTSLKNGMRALVKIPVICLKIYKAMQWADHIHVRCPGNIGLLGSMVQILFPKKPKTVKYAGNWDPSSKQPLSYRFQKWILSNTFLTRNAKVLVYGEWPNQTKNIIPFFTASYSEKEFIERHSEHSETNFSKEQIASSQTPRNDESQRYPEFVSGSHDSGNEKQLLNQIQLDEIKKQITSSQTTRNDETNCHPEPVEGCDEIAQNSKSLRQAQTDICDEQLPNQVQHNELKEQIASSQTPRNDETYGHPEPVEGFNNLIKFLFVGALTKGKQPLLSVQVIHQLQLKGYTVQLDIYGEGKERENIANYILDNSLENEVSIHGNVSKEIVKLAYQKAHFLLFISKSEGWPKVVAEAMFWGCLPISSGVSCIPYMLGNGARGAIVNTNAHEIRSVVEAYLKDSEKYSVQVQKAIAWSRQFTLEKFEEEIGKLFSPLERG